MVLPVCTEMEKVYLGHTRDDVNNSELKVGTGTRLTLDDNDDDDDDDMAEIIIFIKSNNYETPF